MNKQAASELSALLQLYLQQEFPKDAWITTDREVYTYFKNLAQSKKSTPPANAALHSTPIPVQTIVPTKSMTAAPLPTAQPKNEPKLAQPPQPSSLQPELPKKEKVSEKDPLKTEPLPAQKEEKKRAADPVFFTLEPLPSPAPVIDLQEIKALVKEKAPGLAIQETIPDDAEAKRKQALWKRQQEAPSVLVLSFTETQDQVQLLENIAGAIQSRFVPAKVIQAPLIEKNQGWEALLANPELKLIIANDYGLYTMPGLMKHYREVPERGEKFLGNVPLCLMADVSLYLKDPRLKGVLWKAICTFLQNTQP